MQDRRQDPRILLENTHYVSIVSSDRELPAVLVDISASGARMELPPSEVLPPVGSEITVQGTALPLLGKRKASVIWGMGMHFGVRFTERIDVGSIGEL